MKTIIHTLRDALMAGILTLAAAPPLRAQVAGTL